MKPETRSGPTENEEELTEHHGWNREQQQHKGNIAVQMDS